MMKKGGLKREKEGGWKEGRKETKRTNGQNVKIQSSTVEFRYAVVIVLFDCVIGSGPC